MFIPDPNFFYPGSKFVQLASRIRIKEFTQKIVSMLAEIWVGQPGSGSRGQKGTGSATLILRITWLSQHLKIVKYKACSFQYIFVQVVNLYISLK
jgi:hypothetical protein